ncbi:VC0807 family protein [Nocardia huaxiensis]|uniref:Intracellular septation protein A n=1 Tax=Nocardia huaxiensis TaxID=2755382 RepID=A0A7D6ZQT7_9NOCA|nr:VC0807 family protein [Nocardia huaxiensis]QLY33063.1 hypothetical protein H0264_13230 [Nocardia huaxiensis]UFS93172.1 hypothetical protein LPY97_20130 [Nocardia huaxiensis]
MVTNATATTAPVAAAPAATTRPARRSPWRMLAPMAFDIAVPMTAYYLMHWQGYSDFTALLAGALASAALVVAGVIRARRIDGFALIILAGFAIGLVGAMLSGDARLMIIRESFGTGVVGIAFLISAVIGKPLTYAAARRAIGTTDAAHLPVLERAYRTDASVRRTHANLSILWGAGLFGEALVRSVLAYQLPIPTMAWLSTVLMAATMGGCGVITMRTVKRLRKA